MAAPTENIIKPIIREIVRTEVCFPNIQLIVDRISVETVDVDLEKETFRLHLTDGEVNVQGSICALL